MPTLAATPDSSPPTPTVSRLALFLRLIVWLILGVLGSLAIAWVSVRLQWAGLAPFVLFSLFVGGVCGGMLLLLARQLNCGQKKGMVIASLFLGLLTAFMQHVFAYQAYRNGFLESVENDPKAAMARAFNPDFGPASFAKFMKVESRKPNHLLVWTIDATLITVMTVVVLALGMRRTYCKLCGNWHRLVQAGILPEKIFQGIQRHSESNPVPNPLPTNGKYQLWHCLCGCSDAKLKIFYVDAGGDHHKTWPMNIPPKYLAGWKNDFQVPPTDPGESGSPLPPAGS